MPAERCYVCGSSLNLEMTERYVLRPGCLRCLALHLPTRAVDTADVESILLSMYAIPSVVDSRGHALSILCHLAPTCEDVERIRTELHGIDIEELVVKTFAGDLDVEVEQRLHGMRMDAASGLLRWRIDHLCRTACTAAEARVRHHRHVLEGA